MSERSVCASRPLKLNHSYTGVTMTKTVCSIKGCGNTSKNVSERKDKVLFHQFPNRVFDFGRFVAWSNFAKLSSVTHADRICSDHFAPDDYSDATNALTSKLLPQSYLGHHFNPRLKKTAVPSVRPPKLTSDSEFRLDHRGPTSQRNRRGATPSTLSWYWTDRSVVYVDMHGFGYKLLRQGSRHMYFTCSATSECSGKTMTSKRYKNPRMLSGHTHDSDKTHLLYARCWQTFKRYTKNHYTMDKDQIIRGFKAKYPHFATPFNNLHIEASMERWISDIHNIRPKSPDDFDSEEVSNGELSDSESIPPTTTTVNIFHNPSSVYTKCAVPSCNNYFDRTRQEYAGKQYFPFPEDPETRVLWNRAIGKTDDWDPKDSLVCSSHFINSSFETNHHDDSRKELQVGAVPSLNLTISSNVLDPLAEGFADGGNDGNYDELIYAPVKTVNIPSTGNDDSPLSIPVVKVDKFFLQRAKEKALANLAAEKNEAAAGPNRSSTEVNVLRSVMVDPQDQEEVAFELLMDETEENVEEKEMRSCLEDSIHELTSMQRENNKNSVPKSSLPEKKRVLSNHEILNNAESLLRNRFKSKNPVLVSRHKSLKRLERIGGKPSVKGERKPAEKTETKPTKTNGEKPTEKSGEKKTPSKRPSSKVESPSSAKRKRPSGEELVDLEDQKEWRPSKWTVNKWTKAGLIPPDSPKKRHNKERNESETENEEDDEAGYTVVEPLNIRLNINNGTDVEDAGDKQDLSFLKNFEAKDEKSSTMEVPPFKRRSSEVAKRRKRKITPMSADSNSDGDIELIQESSSERRTSTLVENTDVKEEADDTAKITTSELLAVKEEEEEDDLEGQKEDQEEEKEEPEEKKEDTDEEKEEPEEEREELVEEVNVEAAVAAKVKQSNRPARKWPEASRTKKSDESKQKSLEKQVEPPGKRSAQVYKAPCSAENPNDTTMNSPASTNALDWAFFKSILPEVGKLNPRKKAALKMMILDKLNDLLHAE